MLSRVIKGFRGGVCIDLIERISAWWWQNSSFFSLCVFSMYDPDEFAPTPIEQNWANRQFINSVTDSLEKLAKTINKIGKNKICVQNKTEETIAEIGWKTRLVKLYERLEFLEKQMDLLEKKVKIAREKKNDSSVQLENTAAEGDDEAIPDLQ